MLDLLPSCMALPLCVVDLTSFNARSFSVGGGRWRIEIDLFAHELSWSVTVMTETQKNVLNKEGTENMETFYRVCFIDRNIWQVVHSATPRRGSNTQGASQNNDFRAFVDRRWGGHRGTRPEGLTRSGHSDGWWQAGVVDELEPLQLQTGPTQHLLRARRSASTTVAHGAPPPGLPPSPIPHALSKQAYVGELADKGGLPPLEPSLLP